MSKFYELSATDSQQKEFPLSQLQGKVALVVNVASKCGFTKQYTGLEALYQKYKERGFVVVGFPCNQFGGQEPGTDEDIKSFCSLTYNVTFPIMSKVDVNGDNEHPVYACLKSEKAGLLGLKRIKWNFEKFLVGRDGKVIQRWASTTSPEKLEADILKALEAPKPATKSEL